MTTYVDAPFVVPELRGRLWIDEEGDWPAGIDYHLQVLGPDGVRQQVPIAVDGTFAMKNLRPGHYCFKTSGSEFQGYEGLITIDRRAPKDAEIEIKVAYGA
jgi:hypothetical protein